jgi:hypothetical protein
MSVYRHSILVPNAAVAADGDVSYRLPVDPLSVVLIHISPLNETSTIANFSLLEALLGCVDNLQITFRGGTVVAANGEDLAMLAMVWHRMSLWQSGLMETDNFRRSLVLPVCLGRRPYMQSECFPAVNSGELILTVTWDIADTGVDGLRISVETITLPGAAPTHVQKVMTTSETFAATGQNDVELPIGNVLRGLLLWGTTSYTGATPAPTWGRVSVLKSNVQTLYTSTDWEVGRGTAGLMGTPFPPDYRHIHGVNAAGAGQEDTQEPEVGTSLDDNYLWLPFDVTGDDEYSVDAAGASRMHVRAEAEAAEAVRVLPVERVEVSRFLEGP